MATLELRPMHTNIFIEKKSSKKSPFSPGGPSSLKIIIIQLTEVIAIYI